MTAATGADGAASGKTTILRKYANRRLYDTSRARCVTLADVAARVRDGERVRVVDARSGGDVTRQALAQILCESETSSPGMLDADVLARLIRISGTPEAARVSEAFGRALDRLALRRRPEHTARIQHAAAMLRPRGLSEVRAVAARIDALEARLHSLMDGAEAAPRRHPQPGRKD